MWTWADTDPKKPVTKKAWEALERYRQRFGIVPGCLRLNEKSLEGTTAPALAAALGVEIQVDDKIPLYNFRVD